MPWYGDHPHDLRIRQESYLVQFVVPFVERNFPVVKDPSGRMLLGISKSGCGAFTVLLRHPDVFGKAVAWDAPLLYDDITAVKAAGTEAVFGTRENFEQYYLPNLLKEKAALLRGRPARLVLMGYGFCQDQVEKAHGLMQALKIPHVYDNKTRRVHQWQSGWFPDAVRYLVQPEGLGRQAPGKKN
jgi:S-formylglutathione hydrolase FrmB